MTEDDDNALIVGSKGSKPTRQLGCHPVVGCGHPQATPLPLHSSQSDNERMKTCHSAPLEACVAYSVQWRQY